MRWLVFAAVAVVSSWGLHASEAVMAERAASEIAIPVMAPEQSVIVTPIPMPAPVVEVLKTSAELRATKKIRVTKQQAVLPKSILSRTERHQLALMSAQPKPNQKKKISIFDFFNEDDHEYGIDDLDLHRSFSRPRVLEVADRDDEDADDGELSDSVKLRLFLARTKAVEAHRLAQAAQSADDSEQLSEAVKLRLFMARMKAVQAHEKKFS